jgi:hypothetical protein
LNRGKRFCRPLRNHSATWPLEDKYVNAPNQLSNGWGFAISTILNAGIARILNDCSLDVRGGLGLRRRQQVRIALLGGGEGAFQGALGVALIGPLGAMP